MATITAYQTAAGKRYRVRYRKPDRAQTDKRGFKTKKEAEVFLASVTISKATGAYIDPQAGRTRVDQLSAGWLAGKKSALKPSSYDPLERSWRVHVEPVWGAREVKSVQPSEVRAWVASVAGEKSATTVSRALGVLAGILDTAVDDRRLGRNPARGIATPKKKPKPRRYLTHAQVEAVANEAQHPALVYTLAYTGLRWGEATALRVRNFNRLRRRLTVEENAVLAGGRIHLGTPKTHEKRTVPVPKFLAVMLEELAKGKQPDELLFGDGEKFMRLPDYQEGWFAAAVGRVRRADLERAKEAQERGDEEASPIMPRVTPHDLRHTAASLAISAGANPKAVQRMLGHASAAMTLDTYADLFEDDLEDVADALDRAHRDRAAA